MSDAFASAIAAAVTGKQPPMVANPIVEYIKAAQQGFRDKNLGMNMWERNAALMRSVKNPVPYSNEALDKLNENQIEEYATGANPGGMAISAVRTKSVLGPLSKYLSAWENNAMKSLEGRYPQLKEPLSEAVKRMAREDIPTPYIHQEGFPFQIPNYKAPPTGEINSWATNPGDTMSDPFWWADKKYRASQNLLRKNSGPVHIKTGSDYIADDAVMAQIPKGSVIDIIPNAGRELAPANPSNKRVFEAAKRLKQHGFNVTVLPPYFNRTEMVQKGMLDGKYDEFFRRLEQEIWNLRGDLTRTPKGIWTQSVQPEMKAADGTPAPVVDMFEWIKRMGRKQ